MSKCQLAPEWLLPSTFLSTTAKNPAEVTQDHPENISRIYACCNDYCKPFPIPQRVFPPYELQSARNPWIVRCVTMPNSPSRFLRGTIQPTQNWWFPLLKIQNCHHFSLIIIIIIYPLTARVVGAPYMISQQVSSIFACSPLPSGTRRTPGLSIS